jgi:formamidopyrimidine-DNA glycosylase
MPELPEVETIRACLHPVVVGRAIVAATISDPRLTAPEQPGVVAAELVGERIDRVARRGKYLVFELSSGRHLLSHLRMTGSFRHSDPGSLEDDPYRRAVVSLDDGSDVAYRDVRRFGTWRLLEAGELGEYLDARLGPEPLGRAFTAGSLASSLAGRRAPIKSALLDQRTVAGVGNIYADEALWLAGVHPRRPGGSLDAAEIRALHAALRTVLRLGIRRQGATLRDYRSPDGVAGAMQESFAVYGREGEPCERCGTLVERIRIAGRSASYCPSCQAPPDGAGTG